MRHAKEIDELVRETDELRTKLSEQDSEIQDLNDRQINDEWYYTNSSEFVI